MRFIILFLSIIVSIDAISQNSNRQWIEEADRLKDENPEKSDEFVDRILGSDSSDVELGIWRRALQLKGLSMMYNYQFDTANYYLSRALSTVTDQSESSESASLLMDIGRNFTWQSRYDTALSLMLEARRIYNNDGNRSGVAEALNAIAIIYIQYSNDALKALNAFREALKIHRSDQDTASLARIMQNIGQIHNMMGNNDSALYYLRISNHYSQQQKDYRSLAIGNNILGAVFFDLNSFDSSEVYFKKAIELDLINQDSVGLIYDYSQLSRTLWKKGDLQGAQKYGSIAFDATKDLSVKSETAETLSSIFEASGHSSQALIYYKHFKYYTDSIRNKDQRTTIADLQARYETAEKEKQIELAAAELDKERGFRIFLTTISVLIVVFSTLAIFLVIQRSKLKNALLSQEIDNLRLQINTLVGKEGNTDVDLQFEEINTKLNNPLSEREFEILQMAIGDRSNREIAETVFVSINTVKFHLRNIYTKLGVSNRKEAMQFVIRPT